MSRTKVPKGVTPRVVGGRPLRQGFLIICEGEKTEPNYFRCFGKPPWVTVIGTGKNTKSLVDEAKELKRGHPGYLNYWCVFDRDSFPAQNFNNAIQSANDDDIYVAYSNEAFEIWYLLHFDFHTSALGRDIYAEKLTERLGKPYKKNDTTMFDLLRARLPQAIKFARKLLETYSPHNPEKDNPSTTVHLLVENLLDAAIAGRNSQGALVKRRAAV